MNELRPVSESEIYKNRQRQWCEPATSPSQDDLENPNSFWNVSMKPENKGMWIGVRQVTLSGGVVVSDAKWIDREKEVVLENVLRAEKVFDDDIYFLYGPWQFGGRPSEVIARD